MGAGFGGERGKVSEELLLALRAAGVGRGKGEGGEEEGLFWTTARMLLGVMLGGLGGAISRSSASRAANSGVP